MLTRLSVAQTGRGLRVSRWEVGPNKEKKCMAAPPYLQPLHLHHLVFDSILQGGQDSQLPVDLDLHVSDPLVQILGQVVVAVVTVWRKRSSVSWATTCFCSVKQMTAKVM